MILLKSNVQNIFWLGRYLTRIQYLCAQFPFQVDEEATQYAHAFALNAEDAIELNELLLDPTQVASFSYQFECAKNNIQDLRAVLSAVNYAELSLLIKNANENRGYICDVASECQDILETESETIFLFFSLGQGIEELDRQLRLQQDETTTLAKVGHIVSSLEHLGWSDLEQTWAQLQQVPNNTHFFHFYDSIQQIFEADT